MANNNYYDDVDNQPQKDRPIPKESYEKLKDALIKSVETNREYNRKHLIEIKLRIIDLIRILRFNEKKEKSVVTQQIKNDFQTILRPITLYKMVAEEWNPTQLLEKKEKQKVAIAADGSQILEEGGDGESGGGDDSEGDIVSRREKARENMLTKQIKKGLAQIPKIKPSVVGSESLEKEEEEEQEQEDVTEDTEISMTELLERNNVVVENPDDLIEIAELLKQNKAIIVVVDQHLQVIDIQAGKLLSDE